MKQNRRISFHSDSDFFNPEEEFKIGEDIESENRYQPILMAKVSKIFGSKYKTCKELELELAIMKDDLAQDMKLNPKEWGLEKGDKLNESLIARIVLRDPSFVKISKDFILAKSEVKEWEGVLEACKQRGMSLGRIQKMNSEF